MTRSCTALFVQDDWRVSRDLKLLYGLRYDIYDVPGRAIAERAVRRTSQRVRRSTSNNFGAARRRGLDARRRSAGRCMRANTGMMYDQPLLASYEQALAGDGTPTRVDLRCRLGAARRRSRRRCRPAPAHAAATVAWTVDPDFQVAQHLAEQRAVRARASADHFDGVGRRASTSKGYNLPVVSQHQPDQPDRRARRRPADLSAPRSTPSTRVDPRFNHDQHRAVDRRVDLQGDDAAARPAPASQRHAVRLRLHARQERGQRADHQRAVGAGRRRPRPTRPTSIATEGPNILDQRHTFTGSIVASRGSTATASPGAIAQRQPVRRLRCSSPAACRSTCARNRELEQRRHRQRPAARRGAQLV